MAADDSIAIPIRAIRSSSISMRSRQRRRAPKPKKPMLPERVDNNRQATPTTRALRRPSDKCALINSVDKIGRRRDHLATANCLVTGSFPSDRAFKSFQSSFLSLYQVIIEISSQTRFPEHTPPLVAFLKGVRE